MKKLKEYLKNNLVFFKLYFFIRYFLNRFIIKCSYKNFYIFNNIFITSISIDTYSNSFFGYYNISPENSNNEVLFLEVKQEKIRGSLTEPAAIMLKKTDNSIIQLAETKAWNWQQGCMLQWFGNSDELIIYNDYSVEDNLYITKIRNIITNKERIIHKPIYSVAKTGKFALTLNFDRLALMRPDYGYFNRSIEWDDLLSDSEDGIWYIDIEKNNSKLIISLNQLISF